MICYLDRTFCNAGVICTCQGVESRLTPEVEQAAEKWWNPDDKPELRGKAPIATSYLCRMEG